MTDKTTRDMHGREIMIGDVLKVFHFTAALRRKKHYMYKQVMEKMQYTGSSIRFRISHLNHDEFGYYTIGLREGLKPDYEIVQGLTDFTERERVTAND